MRSFASLQELGSCVDSEIGISGYIKVTQATISQFANATGDHQWIHVDVERAKAEMPEGKTIAHGYLTLSLLPQLADSVYRVKNEGRILNYGLNKVRFTGSVPVDSELRLRLKLLSVESDKGGTRVTMSNLIEIRGQDRPVLIAENIVYFPS
jgi:acyl dehydratase